MTRLQRLGVQILTVALVLSPLALWAWSTMTVTLACTLDESSAACGEMHTGLAQIGFLKLAIVPWGLAVILNRIASRMSRLDSKRRH